MALNGSKTVTVTSWDSLVFSWAVTEQFTAGNWSKISWTLKLVATGSGRIDSTAPKDWSVTVNGTKYSGTNSIAIGNNSTITLASGTTQIAHNSDGTKTFAYSFSQEFSIDFDGWIGTVSGSGSGTLNAIARTSTLTVSNGTLGEAQTLTINRKADSFTHTITYKSGYDTGTIVSKTTATSVSWTPPLDLASRNTTGTSVSVTLTMTTYNGSTAVGTREYDITCYIPASVKPTVTQRLTDVTGVDDIYGSPVQGLSQIKIEVTASTAYSSPIQEYSITANGAQYKGQTATTGFLKTSGGSVVKSTARDARGRTGEVSYTMNVKAYTRPSVTALSVHRCNEDGVENEQGEYIKTSFDAAITNVGGLGINTAAYKLRYKPTTASEFTEITFSDLAGVYTVTGKVYVFAAASDYSYDVEVEAQDRHHSSVNKTSASTAFTIMHFGNDGRSMGVGKVAEKTNTLQIGLDVEFFGKVKGAIFDAIYPVGSIYIAYNHTNPSTLFGGTWARIENAFLWGTTSGGTIGLTSGEQTHTLTEEELPAHAHGSVYSQHAEGTKSSAWYTASGSSLAYGPVKTGGGKAHNNMPPYIQVSIWRRTA